MSALELLLYDKEADGRLEVNQRRRLEIGSLSSTVIELHFFHEAGKHFFGKAASEFSIEDGSFPESSSKRLRRVSAALFRELHAVKNVLENRLRE